MLRNLKNEIYAILVYIGSVAATLTSSAVGTEGINSLAFLIQLSSDAAIDASNYLTVTFTECDTLGGTYVAAGADSYYPDHPLLNEASMAGKVIAAEYRGNAAFVKCVLTETGAVTGTGAIMAISLDPEAKPSNLG